MSIRKVALIIGISGQDGAYLAELLLEKGYEVHGVSRDAEVRDFARLKMLGVLDKITNHSALLMDFRSILEVLDTVRPTEIYNLSGQSSVALSFSQPIQTIESITVGQLQLLEAVRFLKLETKIYNASSSDCYGSVIFGVKCDEETPFNSKSPYATAKAAAHWLTRNYRDAYGIFATNGILFNHESPLRPKRFVTRKIVTAVAGIALKQSVRLELGNLDVYRDWGYAREYVDAMWRIMQSDVPEDFVIATGESHSLQEFVAAAFTYIGENWENYTDIKQSLYRPTDIQYSCGNPKKAEIKLGWKATTKFESLIALLIDSEIEIKRQRLES